MNHPQHNELTELLYGELDAAREAEVTRHLETCDDCRGRVDAWRAVRQDLATWDVPLSGRLKLAPATVTSSRLRPLRWAVAATVLLGAGFGLARFTTPTPDLTALRTELRDELKQEFATTFAAYTEQQISERQNFERVVARAMNRIEARQVAEHAVLRKDVETVAVHTQQEFARLTAFNPADKTGQPENH